MPGLMIGDNDLFGGGWGKSRGGKQRVRRRAEFVYGRKGEGRADAFAGADLMRSSAQCYRSC